MTVSFIAATSAESTSVTLPSHQAGDLIVMLAMRYNSVTAGTIPTGWGYRYVSQRNGTFVAITCAVSCRLAASSAETSGTWTSWTHLLAAVYRDDANYLYLGSPAIGLKRSAPESCRNSCRWLIDWRNATIRQPPRRKHPPLKHPSTHQIPAAAHVFTNACPLRLPLASSPAKSTV